MSWEFATRSLAEDVPGFEIVRETGEGAMGRVYVARQIALDRLVALKFLATDPDDDPAERIARFRREAAIMAALKHPNVLPVFDFGENDGRFFLAMEYVEDGDLRKRMPVGRGMAPAEALAILVPVGEALDYLHSEGILHRDLKPENILMQGDVPKVADFGIAVERTGSGELTRSGQGLGTLGYVAPELQYRLPVDERADQYSLAAMSYEMLTGVRPLGLFKPPSHHNPNLSPRVNEVVLRGLEEAPNDRYPTVLAFVNALRDAFDTTTTVDASKPRNRPDHRLLGLVAAVGLIVVVAALAFNLRSRPRIVQEPIRRRAPAWPTASTPTFRMLVRWSAHKIWLSQGSPTGEEGAAVADYNWEKAERQVRQAVKLIADKQWSQQSEAASNAEETARIWSEAEKTLYQTWGVEPSQLPKEENPADQESTP